MVRFPFTVEVGGAKRWARPFPYRGEKCLIYDIGGKTGTYGPSGAKVVKIPKHGLPNRKTYVERVFLYEAEVARRMDECGMPVAGGYAVTEAMPVISKISRSAGKSVPCLVMNMVDGVPLNHLKGEIPMRRFKKLVKDYRDLLAKAEEEGFYTDDPTANDTLVIEGDELVLVGLGHWGYTEEMISALDGEVHDFSFKPTP